MKKIFITGTAGFIGFHVVQRLLADGWSVVGLDNLNDYYDVSLKEARLKVLCEFEHFHFTKADLLDRAIMDALYEKCELETVIHLAAQAGVRYSIDNPRTYIDSNIVGFLNILECCRKYRTAHLIFASSSSIYGLNDKQPFSKDDFVDHPVSLYAATKKSNELMAHAYADLYEISATGLRFFTVYGPWGRPDMAVFKFTKAIFDGKSIDLYNNGNMRRDFTYIDDVVDGIVRLLGRHPKKENAAPFQIYNIGNHQSIDLERLVSAIETACGRKAYRNLLPMQPGDVLETFADISRLNAEAGFQPTTAIEARTTAFVDWYKEYYGIS